MLNAGLRGVPYPERIGRLTRAYYLARRGYFATAYADGLARLGRIEEARNIAEQQDNEFLRVRVLVAQTLYKNAIAYGLDVLRRIPVDDANAGNAYRILAVITEASRYLGKKPKFAEEVLSRFLYPEPPRVKIGVVPFVALLYSCVDAASPVARRCIKRLREVYARGDAGAIVGAAPSLLEGADRWVEGDAKGAARAWRPSLRESGAFRDEALRHVFVDAFEAAGEAELAVEADLEFLPLVDQPGAIDLALVRAAYRAEKKGDHASARKFATKCIDVLRYADDDVPIKSGLERLVARLPLP